MEQEETIKTKIYDTKNNYRDAEVVFQFEYDDKWYCAVSTIEEPIETQILGYGYTKEGEFFTYDIAEPLYKNVLEIFNKVHIPELMGEEEEAENEAPILEMQGIGKEANITKKGQALMFFSYEVLKGKPHDYVLIAYIEPEIPENRGAFYRYEFLELEDGSKAIAIETIKNEMEYEAVRTYFKRDKGKELDKALAAEHIDLLY